jgi:hypothetical protein
MATPSLDVKQWTQLDDTYKVRDVDDFLSLIFANSPVMQHIPFLGERAKQHKHEWFDELVEQKTSTLTANITAHAASATGLTISVADGTVFLAGDQVIVDTLSPIYKITSISTNDLTVSEIRGVALASDAGNTQKIRFTRAQNEITEYGTTEGADHGDPDYNYTQIFRKDVEVSRHLQEVTQMNMLYPTGTPDEFTIALDRRLKDIAWQLENAVKFGVRAQRTSSSVPGFMGGIRSYIDVSGGNVVTSSGTLTLDNLNEAVELIYDKMNAFNNLVIVMHQKQNKVLATLDSNAIRYNDPQPTRQVGFNVASYIPDISGSNGIPILVDPNMPTNEIWFIDKSRLGLMALGNSNIALFREPQPGRTSFMAYIYGELTFRIRNPKQAFAIIKGLTVPS